MKRNGFSFVLLGYDIFHVFHPCGFHHGPRQRSSHLEVFCKKGVLEYFSKFTGKHLCQSLFFNKVVGLYEKKYESSDH